jgi:hypothetical protein
MKKASVISVFVFFAIVIFTAFFFNATTRENPQNNIFVHVSGCDNCDSLFVCVNGNTPYNPGRCDFYVDCYSFGADFQTICVKCDNKSGTGKLDCLSTKEITVYLTSSLGLCPCESNEQK